MTYHLLAKSRLQSLFALFFISLLVFGTLPLSAKQNRNRPRTTNADQIPQSPLDREANVIRIDSPGVQIGYNQRIRATKIEFRSPDDPQTGKLPNGLPHRGDAKVETKGGFTEIDVQGNIVLPGPAGGIDPKLNTYVLWSITPTGTVQNLSEVLYEDDLGGAGSDAREANVTTTQPVFALMITAEPHFAVSRPSRHVVLISRPQTQGTDNAGLKVADYIAYSPSNAPNDISPEVLNQIPAIPTALDVTISAKFRQLYTTLNQARMSIAMSQTAIDTMRDIRAIARDRTIEEAELLIKDPGHKSLYDRMQVALENRLRVPLYEETQAKFSLEDANSAYERARVASERLNPKTTDRLPFLPIMRDARLAVQSAAAAKEFADIAAARVEVYRLRIMKDTLIDFSDELANEIKNRNERIAQLEGELRRANDKIRQLEDRISDLERRLDDAQRRIGELERENAALRAELDRFCQELRRVVGNLGEIIQSGNTITVRLKSDILFPEGVWLLTVDRDLNKDARPRLAQLALLLQMFYSNSQFAFVGHTDTVDEPDYNQWLSEQRALEVMRFFYIQRAQFMDSGDPLYGDYQQKISVSDQLLDNRLFPEWLSSRRKGGLGADRRKQEERAVLLDQLRDVVRGMGETQLAVPTADNTTEARNRRVEIQITLPPQSALPYCNSR